MARLTFIANRAAEMYSRILAPGDTIELDEAQAEFFVGSGVLSPVIGNQPVYMSTSGARTIEPVTFDQDVVTTHGLARGILLCEAGSLSYVTLAGDTRVVPYLGLGEHALGVARVNSSGTSIDAANLFTCH